MIPPPITVFQLRSLPFQQVFIRWDRKSTDYAYSVLFRYTYDEVAPSLSWKLVVFLHRSRHSVVLPFA